MPEPELGRKVREAFAARFGRRPEVLVRAPGRVCLLGAHVDFNGGLVLPGAIDRAVWLAAGRARGGGRVLTLESLGLDSVARLDLEGLLPPVPERQEGEEAEWWDYPAGIAWALESRGLKAPGMDGVLASDVPVGAGVSSSAALEVAVLLAWLELGDLELDGEEAVLVGREGENGYVGVETGMMDQFASLHGREGSLLLLDCRTLEHEYVPLSPSCSFLVADSGVRRRLSSSGYNDRRAECRQALEVLRRRRPGLEALGALSPPDLEWTEELLPAHLERRVRHVVEECQRVQDGAAALRRGDLAAFGSLVQASHASSRDLYEVSLPELDALAEAAWGVEGCHGARLAGGGFGGCVTALAENDALPALEAHLTATFETCFHRTPAVFTCRPAPGATTWRPDAPGPP